MIQYDYIINKGAVIILSKEDPAAFEIKTKESSIYKLRGN